MILWPIGRLLRLHTLLLVSLLATTLAVGIGYSTPGLEVGVSQSIRSEELASEYELIQQELTEILVDSIRASPAAIYGADFPDPVFPSTTAELLAMEAEDVRTVGRVSSLLDSTSRIVEDIKGGGRCFVNRDLTTFTRSLTVSSFEPFEPAYCYSSQAPFWLQTAASLCGIAVLIWAWRVRRVAWYLQRTPPASSLSVGSFAGMSLILIPAAVYAIAATTRVASLSTFVEADEAPPIAAVIMFTLSAAAVLGVGFALMVRPPGFLLKSPSTWIVILITFVLATIVFGPWTNPVAGSEDALWRLAGVCVTLGFLVVLLRARIGFLEWFRVGIFAWLALLLSALTVWNESLIGWLPLKISPIALLIVHLLVVPAREYAAALRAGVFARR